MSRLVNLIVSLLMCLIVSIWDVNAQVYLQENFDLTFVGNPSAPPGWLQKRIQVFGDEKPVPNGIIGPKDFGQNNFVHSNWTFKNTVSWDPISVNNNGVLWLEDALFGPNANAMARRIESPSVNLSAAISPFLFFNYFNAAPSDTSFPLIIVYSTDNGQNWKPLMHIQPNGAFKAANTQSAAMMNATSEWSKIALPIPPNLKLAQVKFGFQKNASMNQTSNLYIDSFCIKEYSPTTITSLRSGLWSNPDTWGGIVPNGLQHVVIAGGHTLEIDVNIARTQQLTILGNLRFYSSSPSQVLQSFGNLTIQNGATYTTNTTTNNSLGRATYLGGNLVLNGNFVSNSNTSNALYMSGASLNSISGNGQFSNNRISRLYIQNAIGVNIDLPMVVSHALYLIEGNLNPNGKLTIGHLSAASNVTIVKSGRAMLTQRPLYPLLGTYTRSVFYGGICNGNMPSSLISNDTIYTGFECDSLNGVDLIILGNLTIQTSGIVKLNHNLKVGNTSVGGSLSLMRGLIITSASKLLTIGPLGNGHIGVEPSKTVPYFTQGSYVLGPIRFDRGTGNSNTIYVPIGLGADGVYSTSFNNQLKTLQLSPGTNWNAQTITFTCHTQNSGPLDTGLTTMASDKVYHLNLNGGNDLASTATIAIRGMNTLGSISDNLYGNSNQVFIGQSTGIVGNIWKRKGNALTGSISRFEQNQQYLFYSANTGTYGSIAPLASKGTYFSLVSNAISGTLISSQVIKNSDAVSAHTKQALLCKIILNCGGQIPLQLNQMIFNFNGTNKLSNIQSFKVMYGASDSLFINAKQFGNTINSPTNNITISANQQLTIGNNYFWVLADIQSTAIIGDSISVNLSSVNFSTFSFGNFTNAVMFKKIAAPLTFISVLPIEKRINFVAQNTFDNVLLKIPIQLSSTGAQISLTKLTLDIKNNVTNAWQKLNQLKLNFSGNQNSISASIDIAKINYPNGIIEFSSPVLLNKDTNYFWLTADIEKYASLEDSFSIALNALEFNGNTMTNINQTSSVFKIKSSYPISGALSNTDEEIWGVSLGSLNNQTNCNSIGGNGSIANRYNDYTAINPPQLIKGNNYYLILNLGSCAANNLSNAAVYIDYNQNNKFNDDGELVYTSGVHNSSNTGKAFNGWVKIPVYAKAGITRMRIVYAEQIETPLSLGYYSNGETEDYHVNITDLPYQEYVWTGNTSKNYQTPSNWQPYRNTPNFNDKLVFKKGNYLLDSVKSETIRCLELKDSCSLFIQNKFSQNLSIFDSLVLNQKSQIRLSDHFVIEIGIDTIQTGCIIYAKSGIYGSIRRWFKKNLSSLVFPLTDSLYNTHFSTISISPNPSKFGAITCSFIQSNPKSDGLPFQSDLFNVNKNYPNGYWKITSSNLSVGTLFNLTLSAENIQGIHNLNKFTNAFRPWSNGNWFSNGTTGIHTLVDNTVQIRTEGNNQFGEFTIASDSISNSFNSKHYVNLRCYLQSLYKGDGILNSAFKASGIFNLDQFADSVTLNLWQASSPPQLINTTQFLIDTLGYGIAEIPTSIIGKNCYWEIKHRNSIATWSADPVWMNEACNTYDFTYGDYLAFGNNQADFGDGSFLIYAGDVNQDGFVDGNDFIEVDNDNAIFNTGYKASDVNGDGFVDGNDFTLIDNNNSLFIGCIAP